MDGVALLILIVTLGGLFALAGGARSRRDEFLRRRFDPRTEAELYRTTRTDATGMVVCRRCGADGREAAGACPRCGAPL